MEMAWLGELMHVSIARQYDFHGWREGVEETQLLQKQNNLVSSTSLLY